MATNRFTANAVLGAQVNTLVLSGTIATSQYYAVAINGKTVSYTALNTDTNALATAALLANLQASTIPEFLEVSWAAGVNSTTITGTAQAVGMPFTQTSSATGTGTLVTTAGIAQPAISSTSTATSGGTLLDTTQYFYRLTAINAFGETQASTEASRTTGNSGGNTNTITVNWATAPAGTGITGFNIYRSTTTNTEVLLATTGSSAASYVDTGTAAGSTAYPTVNTTVNSGPNDWSVPANWSLGSVPAAGQDIVINNCATDLTWNVPSSGPTFATWTQDASFTGRLGLPDISESGGYFEYRQRFAVFGVTNGNAATFGNGVGGGSGRTRINFNATQPVITVYATGQPIDPTIEALQLTNTASGATLTAFAGSIGLCVVPGDTATLTTINVGSINNPATDVTLRATSGLTLATLNQNGGDITLNAGLTTITKTLGTTTILGTGAVTTMTLQGGTLWYESSGTITTLSLQGGVIDFSRDNRARTITTATVYKGSGVNDPAKTTTPGWQLVGCGIQDLQVFNLGTNLTVTRS